MTYEALGRVLGGLERAGVGWKCETKSVSSRVGGRKRSPAARTTHTRTHKEVGAVHTSRFVSVLVACVCGFFFFPLECSLAPGGGHVFDRHVRGYARLYGNGQRHGFRGDCALTILSMYPRLDGAFKAEPPHRNTPGFPERRPAAGAFVGWAPPFPFRGCTWFVRCDGNASAEVGGRRRGGVSARVGCNPM